jgi:hypothetical protein
VACATRLVGSRIENRPESPRQKCLGSQDLHPFDMFSAIKLLFHTDLAKAFLYFSVKLGVQRRADNQPENTFRHFEFRD